MPDYKVNFKELKARVGVTDVAYALGYRLDRKAGVGRYIELVLGDGQEKRDTIIVSHPNDRGAQTFFRRDGSKGDVLTLIRENLGAFFVTGKDDWQKTAKVMARFANMPEPEYHEDWEYLKSVKAASVFDASRYEVRQIDVERIPQIFRQRGISDETVRQFAPFVFLIRDRRNGNFDGYNIGFPYTGADGLVKGYEIRELRRLQVESRRHGLFFFGYGWPTFPAATRKPSKVCSSVRSAFDAMGFPPDEQGATAPGCGVDFLRRNIFRQPNYRNNEPFPERQGFRLFLTTTSPDASTGLRMIGLLEGIPMKISKAEGGLHVERSARLFNPEKALPSQLAAHLPVHYRTGQWLPPKAFKDWNDCLLNKPLATVLVPRKEERDRNLAERRKGSLKM